jgi:hypothetical protein
MLDLELCSTVMKDFTLKQLMVYITFIDFENNNE